MAESAETNLHADIKDDVAEGEKKWKPPPGCIAGPTELLAQLLGSITSQNITLKPTPKHKILRDENEVDSASQDDLTSGNSGKTIPTPTDNKDCPVEPLNDSGFDDSSAWIPLPPPVPPMAVTPSQPAPFLAELKAGKDLLKPKAIKSTLTESNEPDEGFEEQPKDALMGEIEKKLKERQDKVQNGNLTEFENKFLKRPTQNTNQDSDEGIINPFSKFGLNKRKSILRKNEPILENSEPHNISTSSSYEVPAKEIIKPLNKIDSLEEFEKRFLKRSVSTPNDNPGTSEKPSDLFEKFGCKRRTSMREVKTPPTLFQDSVKSPEKISDISSHSQEAISKTKPKLPKKIPAACPNLPEETIPDNNPNLPHAISTTKTDPEFPETISKTNPNSSPGKISNFTPLDDLVSKLAGLLSQPEEIVKTLLTQNPGLMSLITDSATKESPISQPLLPDKDDKSQITTSKGLPLTKPNITKRPPPPNPRNIQTHQPSEKASKEQKADQPIDESPIVKNDLIQQDEDDLPPPPPPTEDNFEVDSVNDFEMPLPPPPQPFEELKNVDNPPKPDISFEVKSPFVCPPPPPPPPLQNIPLPGNFAKTDKKPVPVVEGKSALLEQIRQGVTLRKRVTPLPQPQVKKISHNETSPSTQAEPKDFTNVLIQAMKDRRAFIAGDENKNLNRLSSSSESEIDANDDDWEEEVD